MKWRLWKMSQILNVRRLAIVAVVALSVVAAVALAACAPAIGAVASPPLVIDAALLAGMAGALLALAFAYIPGVEAWFGKLTSKGKAFVMAILLALASVAIFVLGCGQFLTTSIACTSGGAMELIRIFLAALVANQGTYLLGVRPVKSAVAAIPPASLSAAGTPTSGITVNFVGSSPSRSRSERK